MSAAPAVSATPPPPAAAHLAVAAVLCCTITLCAVLWPHWTGNPDLSHGMAAPFVFIYLIHEARTRGTRRHPRPGPWLTVSAAALGLGALVFGVTGGLYAAGMGWGHPLAAGLCGAALAALIASVTLNLSHPSVRLIPLNWQSVCAALVWLPCLPMPPGAYSRLSGALQLIISKGVMLMLNILGVPATRHGNIIELAHCNVGVEEACSGVRSLVACMFAALLISALLLRSPVRRVVILLAAAPLAIAMNFVRSLGLTLAADSGMDISGAVHDITGYAILIATTLLLFGFAVLLERGDGTVEKSAPKPAAPCTRSEAAPKALVLTAVPITALLLVVGLTVLTLYPRKAINDRQADPEDVLARQLPGWTQRTSTGLEQFAGTLGTDKLVERTYASASQRTMVSLYVASWPAGGSTPAQVALHTPEVCWPSSGWRLLPESLPGPVPPGAQARAFQSPSGEKQYVFYWHLYDGLPVANFNPRAPFEMMTLALRYGFRAPAPQAFLRISSDRPWSEIRHDAPVLHALDKLGISGLSAEAQ